MNIELQQRLIKYSLQYMRHEIHELQVKIITETAQLQEFSGSTITDFAARLGSTKTLHEESAQAAQFLVDSHQRLKVLMDDYTIVQKAWQEVRDRETAEAMAYFWRKMQ